MARKRARRRRRPGRGQATPPATKMVQPRHTLPIYNLVDEETVERIHQKSMQILSEGGIAFYDDEAQAILKEHGVDVRDDIAYFDPALVAEYVAKAPRQFTQLARNPAHNVTIGGDRLTFAPVYGPPFVVDLDRGRREATLADFQNFVKLTTMTPYLHHSGGVIVEPTDEPVHTRHLDMIFSHVKYSDKAFMGAVTSPNNAADGIRMAEIVFGAEAIRQNPALIASINVSSPRRLDERMLGAVKAHARANQAVMVTPFILSGAMGPVSIAGTLAQLNAEALAGIAFTQMVNPGTPVIYGSFQTTIDLRSGAPVFGAPESQLSVYVSAQMARRYGVPFRSSGMYASSKIVDAQAAYESVMAMMPGLLAHVHFVLHAAGWLENGLAAGYEKFVLDCELLGMFHKYLQGIDFSEDAFAMESILDVPPGGHHLGTPYTMQHFRTAFYRADLFDYESAERWLEEGAEDAARRANRKYKQLLRDYEPPPLDPAVEEELRDYVARRKSEITPEY